MGFVGRTRELGELHSLLRAVERGRRADRGTALLLRGRRRIGKSRLVSEFVERSGRPYVWFQAARSAPLADEPRQFADAIAGSTLPGAALAAGMRPSDLTAALRLLAATLPDDRPSIVVIDELPWLLESSPGGAGELQRVWDAELSRKPVLALLVGSDLAMMEELARPDRPFFGRATEMVLDPLTPADVAAMAGLGAMDAFDAHLVTGGLPLVAQEWDEGMTLEAFLRHSFDRSTSALVVSGGRTLDAEFPETSMARQILTAIGGRGERTFTRIQQAAAEPMNAASLTTNLGLLAGKRIVAADEPSSTRPAPKDRRWRIADPALRFWLAFVAPSMPDIDRGRGDLAVTRVLEGFAAWRDRAIEPVVRDALSRLLPDDHFPTTAAVGGWWPRTNDPEIDLVGTDGRPARTVTFVGTIKWRPTPLVQGDVERLVEDGGHVPGAALTTPVVAVCPGGRGRTRGLSAVWTADDLLAAWP